VGGCARRWSLPLSAPTNHEQGACLEATKGNMRGRKLCQGACRTRTGMCLLNAAFLVASLHPKREVKQTGKEHHLLSIESN
jgi:hypothetical protein